MVDDAGDPVGGVADASADHGAARVVARGRLNFTNTRVTAAAEIGYSSPAAAFGRDHPVFPRGVPLPMYDTLSETQGCDLLSRLFTKRGYAIKRNVQFREYGVEFHIDGWDPQARVGFEFLTSEDEDHDDLSLVEYKALMEEQRRGGLSLFVIDEVEPISAADLEEQANEFLDEVEAARAARRSAGGRKATAKKSVKPAKKAAAKKPAAKKLAVKRVAKPAAAAKKPAAKKPAKRRR
jgi:hypothetical protein